MRRMKFATLWSRRLMVITAVWIVCNETKPCAVVALRHRPSCWQPSRWVMTLVRWTDLTMMQSATHQPAGRSRCRDVCGCRQGTDPRLAKTDAVIAGRSCGAGSVLIAAMPPFGAMGRKSIAVMRPLPEEIVWYKNRVREQLRL